MAKNRGGGGNEPATRMRDTAMPGQGSGRSAGWKGGNVKQYDRLNPDPGRKAGGAAESGGFQSAQRRAARGYGQLDSGEGRGIGVKNFAVGSQAGSKLMNQTTGTPTSVLNTGESKFGSISSRDPNRPSGSVAGTGELDAGYGTGIGGKRP